MNKKIIFVLLGSLVFTIVACEIVNRTRDVEENPTLSQVVDSEQDQKPNAVPNTNKVNAPGSEKKISEEQKPEPTQPAADNPPADPATHVDNKALDEKVTERAKMLGEDPKIYRMFVRSDPDGAKIYRMLGMYVIVNPNKEEVFLPDEI